jgi:hypothetical protein
MAFVATHSEERERESKREKEKVGTAFSRRQRTTGQENHQ